MTVNAPLVITTFHRDVFAAISTSAQAQVKLATKLASLIASKYGDKLPSFEQHRADHAALADLCKQKGLKDNQYYRKTWNLAIKAVFDELPVSQDPASVAKRLARGKAAKSGAPKGETTPRKPAQSETIEQLIARIGVFKVLETCAKLLEVEESTKGVATQLRAIKAA